MDPSELGPRVNEEESPTENRSRTMASLPLSLLAGALLLGIFAHITREPPTPVHHLGLEVITFLGLFLPTLGVIYLLFSRERSLWDGVRVTAGALVGLLLTSGAIAVILEVHTAPAIRFDDVVSLLLAAAVVGTVTGATASYAYLSLQRTLASLERSSAESERLAARLSATDRVLRHNLRNELNLIHGTTGLLQDSVSNPERAQQLRTVQQAVERLLTTSETASQIQHLFETRERTQTYDLPSILESRQSEAHEMVPEITYDLQLPAAVDVAIHPSVPQALTRFMVTLSENTRRRAEYTQLSCSLTVNQAAGTASLTYRVPSSAFQDGERIALRGDRETALNHANDLDLWFVHWAIVVSNGRCNCEELQSHSNKRVKSASPPDLLDVTLTLPLAVSNEGAG